MPRFNLLRYFTLTSFAGLALAVGVVGLLNGHNTQRLLVDEAEQHAVESAETLARYMYDEFVQPKRAIGRDIDLGDWTQYERLDDVIRRGSRGLPVLSIHIFNRQGSVVYSTNRALVGSEPEADLDAGLLSALAGQISSELHGPDDVPHLGVAQPKIPLLETYIPLARGLDVPPEDWGPLAVMELYQDARGIERQVRQGVRRAMLESGASGLALFAVLLLIVGKADRTLRSQRRQLEGWNRDLEERVRHRTAELERSTDTIRRLFNGITDGIAVLSPDLYVEDLNETLREQTRVDAGPLPQDRHCYALFAGRTMPCPGCPAPESLRAGRSASGLVTWTIDGDARHFEITTFPLTSHDKTRPHIIEYIKEVTERRQMEQQLIQADRMASIGILASGLAHEINNPLASVAQCATALERQVATDAPGGNGELSSYLGIITREISRCKAILGGLLNFSRPPSSVRELTDVRAVIEDTYALLRFHFKERGVSWTSDVNSPDLLAVLDGAKLRQILFNLLRNAVDACTETAGTVRCRAWAGREYVAISIADNGVGMAPDTLDRVFDPFFTTKPANMGTGLGLSIAYGLTHELGGTLTAESDGPGAGATFTLRIPRRVPNS